MRLADPEDFDCMECWVGKGVSCVGFDVHETRWALAHAERLLYRYFLENRIRDHSML